MLCWVFCINLYGRLNWRYIGRSDLNYNIKIGSNQLQFVAYEKLENEITLEK
jgi:hypothetical protein